MADRMTKEQRHKCMSRIKGKDTKPELIVRRHLHAHGYRYRINVKRLPGTPDIVLRKYKTVIFINGCFWHGHEGCKYFVMPKSNTPFWAKKIERNKQRDIEKRIQLRHLGWHTIIIWECELKPKNRHTTLQALGQTLNKIFLLNNGAKVTADYSNKEENTRMVAEGVKKEAGSKVILAQPLVWSNFSVFIFRFEEISFLYA